LGHPGTVELRPSPAIAGQIQELCEALKVIDGIEWRLEFCRCLGPKPASQRAEHVFSSRQKTPFF
jgi:hypothetical protein